MNEEAHPVVKATRVEQRRRKPKTRIEERRCETCGTILSKYNLADGYCFTHQTRTFRFTVRRR